MPDSFLVTVRGRPEPVAVATGQTVLEAALAQGLPWPHGCRSGNCGACKSRLFSGEVEMSPCSEYALSAAERRAGLVLACRSVPWSDAEIAWLDDGETASHPLRVLNCRVAGARRLTHDIRRVRLRIVSGGPWTFSAGQHASVGFAGLPPRDYSMANVPSDPALEFHIRHVPGGRASGYAADRLAVGEEVRVEGPYGACWLREADAGPILAVAGGSGLAPMKSVVEQALAADRDREIRLYHGVRGERDLYLEGRFRRLAATCPGLAYTPVLSEPGGATRRRTGPVHEALRDDLNGLPDPAAARAYIAGPPPMVAATAAVLEGAGLAPERIHADAFFTEAEKSAPATPPAG